MTKAPRAGQVKTRLTPPLTPEEAAALNICFLKDIANSISTAAGKGVARGIAVYTPVGAESAYDSVLPDDFALIPQRGDKFGERLIFALKDLLSVGFASVCLINSDSPTVPAQTFAKAVELLSQPGERAVLGPSDDGGYYLIGLKTLHRRLFEEIDWSTERVLEQTLDRAREIKLEVQMLPNCFDVDDKTTLQRLSNELLGSDAESSVAPETRRYLSQLLDHGGRERIIPAQ